MKHGGKRPGAGRPRKRVLVPPAKAVQQDQEAAPKRYTSAEDYFLDVMNDQQVMSDRRDHAAGMLLRFGAKKIGKGVGGADDKPKSNSLAVILGGKK